jgi:tripartite-type tricarboxylate transporter receptor subunit TctC
MIRLLTAVLATLALLLPGVASAQLRSSKIVVAFPPGGPVDIVARLIADPIAKELGLPVIVENKAGGNTFIAAEMVARSPADGSVMFLSSMSTVVLNPLLYPSLPYDVGRDFAPVSLVVSSPTILVVNAANPATDVASFVAAAKASGKPVAFSSAGVGGTTHIALELFIEASGANILHVPFKGAAPAISDLVNNQVGGFFGDLPGVIGHIKGGTLKALAVAAKSGTPILPGVKTTGEQGMPNVLMENWYALYMPAKTPADIIAKANKAVHAALATESVRQKLIEAGANIMPSTPEAVTKLVADDQARMGAVIKAKNIKVD